MSSNSPFLKAPPASLTEQEVIEYLTEWTNRGYVVMTEHDGSFLLILDDVRRIGVNRPHDGQTRLSTGPGTRVSVTPIKSARELRARIETQARALGIEPGSPPPAIRLVAGQPASNLARLVALVGKRQVDAVFDPYLNNQALANLGSMRTFGVGFTPALRLLTSKKMVDKGEITRIYASQFFQEVSATSGGVRYSTAKHHRRFLLLSGGDSLLLGPSLNSLAVDEAARIEPDTVDRSFFDNEWTAATII